MKKPQMLELLKVNANLLVSLSKYIPEMGSLSNFITELKDAAKLGYLSPSQDEQLMEYYVSYLRDREILLEIIEDGKALLSKTPEVKGDDEQRVLIYATSLCAALILRRIGLFIVNATDENDLVLEKLDQAEQRYKLERKTFATIYSNLTSPINAVAFHEAVRFYEMNQNRFEEFPSEPGLEDLFILLKKEYTILDYKKRDALTNRLKYRWYSVKRRGKSSYVKAMFHIFKFTGSAIAELKQPHLVRDGKKVHAEILKNIRKKLLPGDILVTRHDDALSNLFLPGYWPHAAFYAGCSKSREELGIEKMNEDFSVVEAKKDGVKLRELDETLAVDEFLVFRSKLDKENIKDVVKRAISHSGKGYDFLFDFAKSDRLACTEVVYRAYEPIEGIEISLIEKAGRLCLPAQDMIEQLLDSGNFNMVAYFNGENETLYHDEEANTAFKVHQDSLIS